MAATAGASVRRELLCKFDQLAWTEILRKAVRMCGRHGFTRSDVDDIAQELFARWWESKHEYDHRRGTIGAFVATVVDRELKSLLRYRTAKKRDYRRTQPLHFSGDDGDSLDRLDPRRSRTTDGTRHVDGCDELKLKQLAMDLSELRERLTDAERELAERLSTDESVKETAARLGIPRTTVHDHITRLRRKFERTGLGDYF